MSLRFEITAASVERDERGVERLLHDVYVGGGFADEEAARSAFAAAAVFGRGDVLVARTGRDGEDALAGMVIVVPPTSSARRLAAENEVELHLLAVAPGRRKAGVGERLVKSAIELGRAQGASKMWLWTQPSMTAAHRLYERAGFTRVEALDFERAGRMFRVLERRL